MEQPGLISATFHRSLDGTRIINYGQWTREQAIAELAKKSLTGRVLPKMKIASIDLFTPLMPNILEKLTI